MKNKERIKVVAGVIAITTLCGIAIGFNHTNTNYKNIFSKDISVENTEEDYALIDEYIAKFSESVEYPYAELYLSMDESTDIVKSTKNHKVGTYDGSLDAKEIAEKIIENTENTLQNKDDNYASVFTIKEKELVKNELELCIFDIINNSTNDINEDLSLIENLSIYYSLNEDDFISNQSIIYNNTKYTSSISTNVRYDIDKNAIIINPKIFKEIDIPREELLRGIIRNNIIHIRQTNPSKDSNSIVDFNNDLILNTLIEGSALSYYDDKDLIINSDSKTSYCDEKKLALLSMFNKEATKDEYYKVLFDEDIDGLYELYNLSSKEDFYEFYKAFQNMNADNNLMMRAKHYDITKDKTRFKRDIGNYNVLYIYQRYVKDMLNYLKEHPDFSLEDNLFMYNIGAKTLMDNTQLNENYNDVKLLIKLYQLNEEYLNFLCKYYDVTREDLDDTELYLSVSNIMSSFNVYYDKVEYSVEVDTSKAEELLSKFPMLDFVLNDDVLINYDFKNSLTYRLTK